MVGGGGGQKGGMSWQGCVCVGGGGGGGGGGGECGGRRSGHQLLNTTARPHKKDHFQNNAHPSLNTAFIILFYACPL